MANTNKKPTIVENFNTIKDILETNGLLTDELAEFIDKRIAVTEKKNASGGEKKLTPTQIANKGIAKAIFDYLADNGKSLTISQMIKEVPACSDLSNQKINGILLREYNSVKYPNSNPMFVRSEVKGVAYFSINPDYEVVGE